MHILRCFCPRGQSKYYTVILFSRPHNNNTAAIIMPLHYCITSYIIVYYIYINCRTIDISTYYELKYKLLQICLLALLINIVVLDWVCKYNTHTHKPLPFLPSYYIIDIKKIYRRLFTSFPVRRIFPGIGVVYFCIFVVSCFHIRPIELHTKQEQNRLV